MNLFSQLNQVKKMLSCILILIFAITIVYFNSLKGSFQYDDYGSKNRIWVSNLDQYNKRVNFYYYDGNDSTYFLLRQILAINTRPAVLFTYALNNTIGKNSTFGFHLLNFIFHALTTVILFFVVRLAFQISRSFTKNGTSFALIASSVFAIHPALTESVTYISSRSSEMMTFFYLLGVWFFLQFFRSKKLNLVEIIIHSLLIALCFYFSIASKIVGATFPATLALLFIFLICPNKYPTLYKTLTSRLFLFGYVSILISSLMFALKSFFVNEFDSFVLDEGIELYGNVGYFCSQVKIIVFYYLKILLWPINLNADISYPFTLPLVDSTLILAALIGLGFIATAIFKGGPWAKICTGWFIFTLAPTSSILPLNDLAVEHRLYLPATLGICPLFALLVQVIPRKTRYIFLTLILVFFAILTVQRNKVWTNEFNLWKDALKKSPHSPRPYVNLGKAYYEKDEIDLSLKYFKKSLELSDILETTHYNLANIYMDKNQLNLSKKEYQRTIELNPLHYQSYFGLGSIQNQTGKLKEAEKSYLEAINIRSTKVAADEDYPLARINLGEVYGKMGQYEKSIEQSKIAIKSIPNSFKAHYNIGTANMKLGRLEQAEKSFLNCLKIKPKYENALYNLAFIYQKLGQFENSNLYFSEFLDIKNSFPRTYVLMGINYAQMNKLEQAADSFKKALVLDPKILNARTLLAKALSQDGKSKEAIEQLEIILAQNPGLTDIRIQLGIMYWKNEGQLDQARKLFETALKSNVNPKERIQISNWLKVLNKK
jgi:protein O-mannosyl-transferase